MVISKGDQMPEGSLKLMTDSGIKDMSIVSLFNCKIVALFSVPGAITSTYSNKHLTSNLENYGAIKTKGFDNIAYIDVNDALVLDTWIKDRGDRNKIIMLVVGNGEYTKKNDLELDVSRAGFGICCKSFSIVVNDRVPNMSTLTKADMI